MVVFPEDRSPGCGGHSLVLGTGWKQAAETPSPGGQAVARRAGRPRGLNEASRVGCYSRSRETAGGGPGGFVLPGFADGA